MIYLSANICKQFICFIKEDVHMQKTQNWQHNRVSDEEDTADRDIR